MSLGVVVWRWRRKKWVEAEERGICRGRPEPHRDSQRPVSEAIKLTSPLDGLEKGLIPSAGRLNSCDASVMCHALPSVSTAAIPC